MRNQIFFTFLALLFSFAVFNYFTATASDGNSEDSQAYKLQLVDLSSTNTDTTNFSLSFFPTSNFRLISVDSLNKTLDWFGYYNNYPDNEPDFSNIFAIQAMCCYFSDTNQVFSDFVGEFSQVILNTLDYFNIPHNSFTFSYDLNTETITNFSLLSTNTEITNLLYNTNGSTYKLIWVETVVDCDGIIGGTAFIDDCDICVGGETGLLPCQPDCAGVFNGTSEIDSCGICVLDGPSNTDQWNTSCTDCNDVLFGDAFIDDCGYCVGGSTPYSECLVLSLQPTSTDYYAGDIIMVNVVVSDDNFYDVDSFLYELDYNENVLTYIGGVGYTNFTTSFDIINNTVSGSSLIGQTLSVNDVLHTLYFVIDSGFNTDGLITISTINSFLYRIDDNDNFTEASQLIMLPTIIGVGGISNITLLFEDGYGDFINDVEVMVQYELDGQVTFEFITVDGYKTLYNIPNSTNIIIIPEKDINILNGITTLDAILISRHIANFNYLQSAESKISADIDGDGFITIGDLLQLRRLILMIDSTFINPFTGVKNNYSWRFSSHDLIDPSLTSPQVISYDESSEFIVTTDTTITFIGMKIGDVNNSANPNLRPKYGDITITTRNIYVRENDVFEVALNIDDLITYYGFQLNLNLDGIELLNITKPDGLNGEYNFIGNDLLMVYHTLTKDSITNNVYVDSIVNHHPSIINLTFKSNVNGYVSELLCIGDRIKSKLYIDLDGNIQTNNINLSFNNISTTKPRAWIKISNFNVTLYPNPFTDKINLSFYSNHDKNIDIVMYDYSGKILKEIKTNVIKGRNTIQINSNGLPDGFIYIRLKTENDRYIIRGQKSN